MTDENTKKQVSEAADAFTEKLNETINFFRNSDGTMTLVNMCGIHGALLGSAGFAEALIHANSEAMREAEIGRGNIKPAIQRLSVDAIYAAYTQGFNDGIGTAHEHEGEMLKNMVKILSGGS